ncbi:HTH_Tnp_Tc3_2 domain-containing protein [Trichonephila clavipes]|nr:HTH_Tnp_Tc3_2 domain-containing protein [Trichonephila clavipes]
MGNSISEIVIQLGFSRSALSKVCKEYMDGEQKTSIRTNCKGQLVLTVRGERPLKCIVRSQRSQTLTLTTIQLKVGASRTFRKQTATLASLYGFREPSTYGSTITHCSTSGCTSYLGRD